MQRKVLIVNGHPDPRPERFCAALCAAYEDGAKAGGAEVRMLAIGAVDGRLNSEPADASASNASEALRWADDILVVFPLWLDQAPLLLRDFFAKAVRKNDSPVRERNANAVVTMEMPSLLRKAGNNRHFGISLPGLEIDAPTFIGGVSAISPEARTTWLNRLRDRALRAA